MNPDCLEFKNPFEDAISRIRFAPQSNNLLISSWDGSLRLYDVDSSLLRLEVPSVAALLDCCFQEDFAAFSAGSDGFIRRYDLHSGVSDKIGNHDDVARHVQYSDETCLMLTAGMDKRLMSWDMRRPKSHVFSTNLGAQVESISLSGFDLAVAVGSALHVYDLRNLQRSVESYESFMDFQIRCVSSVPYSKGYAAGSVDGRVKLEISHRSNSNLGYVFRCHPKSEGRRYHLISVNDISFNPFISGEFVTGDNEGNLIAWNAMSKRRLLEFPRCSSSVASLTYNYEGQLLAIASSYTYQQANEMEQPPQIFVHKMDDNIVRSVSAGK